MIKELIERLKKNKNAKNNLNYENSIFIYAKHLKCLTDYFSNKQELEMSISNCGNLKRLDVCYKKKINGVEICEKYYFIDKIGKVTVFDSSLKFKEIAQIFALDNLYNNNRKTLDKDKLMKIIKCSKLKFLNKIIKQNYEVYEILNNSECPINDIVYVASVDETYNKGF